MKKKIALTFYELRFKIQRTKNEYVQLGDVTCEGYNSVLDALTKIINSLPQKKLNRDQCLKKRKKVFFFENLEV